MKSMALTLLALLVLAGCAGNTVEKRKKERFTAYSGMPQEVRDLVDQGQIQVGMSPDAVYIAWGKPDQVLSAQSVEGSVTTWLYHDAHLETYRYLSYRNTRYGDHYRGEPYIAYDYRPRGYISAEILFEDEQVKEWRTFPYPVD